MNDDQMDDDDAAIDRGEPMQEKRYEIRQESNGCWTVVNVLTGLPAASDGRDLTGLGKDDASDIAYALNEDVARHRDSPLV